MAGERQRLARGKPGALTQEARIRDRVARAPKAPKALPGVTRLNPGFFQLERMRAGQPVKTRTVPKRKVRRA